MATLEDVKAALEGKENGAELYEAVLSAIGTEKERGISEYRRVNNEKKGLARYKEALEDLGYDGTSDVAEFVRGLSSKVGSDGVKQLERRIEREIAARQALENELNQERQKVTLKEVREFALGKLKAQDGNYKVYGADYFVDALIREGKIKKADTGGVVYVDDGLEIDIDRGLDKVLSTRPDILRNTQRPGSGDKPQSGAQKEKTITQQQFNAMAPKERAAFFADGGTLTE